MSSRKDEIKLLILTYVLCAALFGNLAILSDPIDKKAVYMGVIICIVVLISHFVIRKFYPKGDKFLLIFSSILSIIGIAIIYRLKPDEGTKQIIWFIAGIIIYSVFVIVVPNINGLVKYKYIFLAGVIVLMPLAALFGKESYGAKNWVYIGPVGFQPSEFGKILLVFYLAAELINYKLEDSGKEHIKKLVIPAAVAMYAIGFLVIQRDLGSALIFFGVIVAMLYVGTTKKKYVFISLGLFSVGAVISYKLFSHVQQRVAIWLDPWADAADKGYQIVQGLYAISSGGMFGTGLGRGYTADFVPVCTSDYVYAAICEEFGMIFGIGVMLLFFLLFYRGIRGAFITKNRFSQLVAVGLSCMIAFQTLVIIGGIFAVIPLTGITLPFVSYGGSSMLTIFFALGVLQKVSEEA